MHETELLQSIKTAKLRIIKTLWRRVNVMVSFRRSFVDDLLNTTANEEYFQQDFMETSEILEIFKKIFLPVLYG